MSNYQSLVLITITFLHYLLHTVSQSNEHFDSILFKLATFLPLIVEEVLSIDTSVCSPSSPSYAGCCVKMNGQGYTSFTRSRAAWKRQPCVNGLSVGMHRPPTEWIHTPQLIPQTVDCDGERTSMPKFSATPRRGTSVELGEIYFLFMPKGTYLLVRSDAYSVFT